MCCQDRFVELLHGRGLRLTPQRELILSALHELEGHHTTEEIYRAVQRHSQAIDLSTVYRTLELLEALGFVASIDFGDGERRYELLTTHRPHHHLLCTSCGRVETIPHEALSDLKASLENRYGFELAETAHLLIPGLCRACQQRLSAINSDLQDKREETTQCISPTVSSMRAQPR